MDVLELARWQFAITTVFHFLFVPVTIGLAPLVAIMHTAYVRTGNDTYRRMAVFWGKLFLINFALGVVTGIVQEFQFGMNWSDYSRFVGDIFGAPLALEALLAFFLESTFIGLWVFGWDRLPPKLHLACIWLVAIGTMLSALFILAANSFMQWPVGYELNPELGRAELTSFGAVLTNWHLLWQFPHTILAAWATAGFLVVGVSAYHLARRNEVALFTSSLRIGLIAAFVASLGVAFVGHGQAQAMTEMQPMKMAAAEALWETEQPAGFSLFAVGDVENGRNHLNVQVPNALSLLATNTLDGEVRGINDIQAEYEELYGPGNYIPPVGVTYWSFRLMVGAGLAMIGLALAGLVLLRRRLLADPSTRWARWWLRAAVPAIALPFLANSSGWVMTEVGRQPWVVFGLLGTADGVSPAVSGGEVLTSLVAFTVVYGVLAVVEAWLMVRAAKAGPPPAPEWAEVGEDIPESEREPVAPLIAY